MCSPTRPDPDTQSVVAHRVPEVDRPVTLPVHFGRYMMLVEATVFGFLRRFSAAYQGGYWHFYELSNGGFYMAPDTDSLQLSVPSNGFQGGMSGDAAGITVCLYVFSHLSFQFPKDEVMSRHFHCLRDFAVIHAEATQIMAAID